MHEVVIEAVTDSSNFKDKNINTVFTSTVDQEKAANYYE